MKIKRILDPALIVRDSKYSTRLFGLQQVRSKSHAKRRWTQEPSSVLDLIFTLW